MKKLILTIGFLAGLVSYARAGNELTFSSNTAVTTSSQAVWVIPPHEFSSHTALVDRLDAVHVNTPGSSSKLEVWDFDGTTIGAKGKIGTYDTTAKHNWTFGPYGLRVSSTIIINNTGNPPADITIFGTKTGF